MQLVLTFEQFNVLYRGKRCFSIDKTSFSFGNKNEQYELTECE